MASNSNRGFFPLKDFEQEDTILAVIAASATIYIGDAIYTGATTHTKAVTPAASTADSLTGVVVGIEGVPSGHLPELGGGLVGGTPGDVVAGSGNETTPVYYARYIPLTLTNIKFSAQLSATAGTTTDSDGVGSFSIKTSNAGQLDETTIQLFSTVPAKQFWSYGLDASDTAKFTVQGYFSKYFTN